MTTANVTGLKVKIINQISQIANRVPVQCTKGHNYGQHEHIAPTHKYTTV